jgi:hypothetical protein
MTGPKEGFGFGISRPFEHSEAEHTPRIRDFSRTSTLRQVIYARIKLAPIDARSSLLSADQGTSGKSGRLSKREVRIRMGAGRIPRKAAPIDGVARVDR